jgi:HEAT repeat protein
LLRRLTREGKGKEGEAALEVLARLGPAAKEAGPDLLALLKSGAGSRDLLRALAAAGAAEEAVPVLLRRLEDKDSDARRAAVEALGELGPVTPEVLPALLRALDDKDGFVRAEVPSALGAFKQDAKVIVPALVKVLGQRQQAFADTFLVVNSVRTLGEFGPEARDAAPLLVDLLDVEDESVQKAATVALANVDPSAGPELTPVLIARLRKDEADTDATRALARLGKAARPAIPLLAKTLRNTTLNPVIRWKAADALGAIGPEAASVLTEVLKEVDDTLVQSHIARVLSGMGADARAAVPALLEARFNSTPGVRDEVADTLGLLGPAAREAVPVLLADLSAWNPADRTLFARAVLRIDPSQSKKVVALLGADLKSPVPILPVFAACTLLAADEETRKKGAAVLEASLKNDDWRVRAVALLALANFAKSDAAPLLPAVTAAKEDKDEVVRALADRAARQLAAAGKDKPGG